MKKVIYIYGNLPAYRKDLFTSLDKKLAEEDIELKVFYGEHTIKATKQVESPSFKTQKFLTKHYDLKITKPYTMEGMLNQLKKEMPDGIVMQFNQSNLTEWKVLKWCKSEGIPYAIWGCNYTRPDMKKALKYVRDSIYPHIYKNASVLMPYGSLYRDYFLKIGIPREDIVVVQNSIDVESIISREKGRIHRDFQHSTTKILYVGALHPPKRLDAGIQAVAQLIDAGYDVQFDIVGGGTALDGIKAIWNTFSPKAKERIIFHGAKYGDELVPFFEEADVFFMPGTGGLGVNEAMAYQLPIISTHGDETVFDLIDGNGFFLHHFGDIQEEKEALKKFIELKPEEKVRMAKRSEELILQRASFENLVNKHAEACKLLISKKAQNKVTSQRPN